MLIEIMTKLSSLVIDYLSDSEWQTAPMPKGVPDERNIIIGYIYCDYRDQKDQTETNLLGSLLAQFLACQPLPKPTLEKVLETCETRQKECKPLNLEKALEMISLVVQSSWAFICIDAVDELKQAEQLSFLKSLDKVVRGAYCPCGHQAPRLFLTGRLHVQDSVRKSLGIGEESSITVTANEADIRNFVETQIRESDSEAMGDKLKGEIIETIVAKSGGMYV